MLYVFLANNGTTLTFGLNLAMDTVENLKLAIYQKYSIPPDQQVLLVSGGERLNATDMVYKNKSPAGTDTCPIFLFSKSPVLYEREYNPELDDIHDRVVGCLNMEEPNFNTVQARTEMASELYEADHKIYSICEKLVHDQHLQQQGWAAVVANFEDLINTFAKNASYALKLFQDILKNKETYFQLLTSFDEDKKLLARIPILKCLFPKSENYVQMSMLDWILKDKDNKECSLDNLVSLDHLEHFDEEKHKEMEAAMNVTLHKCGNPKTKEIKGLDLRLSQLETKMTEVRKLFEKQEILSKGFTQNKSRLSDIKDTSILPDLCQNHREQLENMLDNHKSLIILVGSIERAKEELSNVIYERLRGIISEQEMLHREDKRIVTDGIRLQRLRHSIQIIQNLHIAPKIYLKSIGEIYRRRRFNQSYSHWARTVAQISKQTIEKEIQLREQSNLENHIFKVLFKTFFSGLNELPPKQIVDESETEYDQNLPLITKEDIEFLRQQVPDQSDLLLMAEHNDVAPSLDAPRLQESSHEPKQEEDSSEEEKTHVDQDKRDAATETLLLFKQIDELINKQQEMENMLEEKLGLIHNLKQDIADRDETIAQCSHRLESHAKMNVELFELLKLIKTEFDHDVRQHVLGYRDELKGYIETITQLARQNKANNEETIDELKTKLVELSNTMEDNRSNMSTLKTDLDDKNAEVERLRNELDISKQKFVNIDQMMETIQSMVEALETVNAHKDEQFESLKARFDASKQYLATSNQTIRSQLNYFQNVQLELFRTELEEATERLRKELITKTEHIQNTMAKQKDEEMQQLKESLLLDHRMEMDSLRHRYKLAITTTSIERTSSETSLEKVQLDIVDQSAQDKEIQRLTAQLNEQKAEFEDNIAKLHAEHEKKIAILTEDKDDADDEMSKNRMNTFESLYQRMVAKLASVDVNDAQQCKEMLEQMRQDCEHINTEMEPFIARSIISIPNQICSSVSVTSPAMTSSLSMADNDDVISCLNCQDTDKVLVYFDKKYQNYLAFTLTESLFFVRSDYTKDPNFFSDPPNENECVRAEVTNREFCQIKKSQNRYCLPLDTQFFRLAIIPLSKISISIVQLKQIIMSQSLASPQLNLKTLMSSHNKIKLSQSCYNFEAKS